MSATEPGPLRKILTHLGALLIPERYTPYETSRLVIDVQPGMRLPVELHLTE